MENSNLISIDEVIARFKKTKIIGKNILKLHGEEISREILIHKIEKNAKVVENLDVIIILYDDNDNIVKESILNGKESLRRLRRIYSIFSHFNFT